MSTLWSKYENWSKLENRAWVYRYMFKVYQYMFGSVRVYRYMFKVYRYMSPENAQNVYFLPFSIFLIPNSTLYFIHTSKPFHIHLVTSIILNSSFNTYLNSKTYHDLLSNTILIWFITHTQTKYKDLLGFVLTQLLYFAIKP